MAIAKFLSTEKLVEYLDDELRTLLNGRGVYEVQHYGWLDDDMPDPDYIGHAMWQVSPPVADAAYAGNASGEAVDQLLRAGTEFLALMKSGRLSMGYALLHEELAQSNLFGDDQNFWLHHRDALMKLSMASLKIREVFVKSLAGDKVEVHGRRFSRRAAVKSGKVGFMSPFKDAALLAGKDVRHRFQVENCCDALLPMMGVVHSFCKQNGGCSLTYDAQFEQSDAFGCDDFFEGGGMPVNRQDIELAVREMTNWYRTLVEASNLVFLIGHLINDTSQGEIIKMGAGQVHTVDRT